MSEASRAGLAILRNPATFNWSIIPIFVLVLFLYYHEMGKKRYDIVFAGLAFWGMDWFNEIWNALVFHFSGYAPVWGAPGGHTAFLILIGLNIEITLMFLVLGIVFPQILPADRKAKILGLPNRVFYAVTGSALSVCMEVLLNAAGVLTWEYSWWSASCPWLVFLVGYLPFYVVSFWVYDMPTNRKRAKTVGCILGFDVLCLVVFGVLGWL